MQVLSLLDKGHYLDAPAESNSGLWLDGASKFTLYSRVFARVRCPMNFDDYPFDRQSCNFKVGGLNKDVSEEVVF